MVLLDVNASRAQVEALSQLEEHISFRISRLTKLLDSHSTRNLGNAALNLTGYRILLVLSLFKEASAADLSRLLLIDRAQISRSVAEMTKLGFLEYRGDPLNKRRKFLRLSEAGLAAFEQEKIFFERRQTAFHDLLNDNEFLALTRAIDKLSDYLAHESDPTDDLPQSPRRSLGAPAQRPVPGATVVGVRVNKPDV